jgi:heme o synthase
MNSVAAAMENPGAFARDRVVAFYELNKPRVLAMVLITTLAGFYMGSRAPFNVAGALNVLLGTALAAGGTLGLNQYFERDTDAVMERTRNRPLPSGRLTPIEALLFGLGASVAGLVYLWHLVNPLSAIITGAITLLYLAAYTPMKRYSWMCHMVGAIPGALPPVIGWAAARDSLAAEPWVLFGIMFLWQLPHSLSIARLYQADYARAGMSLLPRDRPYGNPANLLMLTATVVLVAFGTLPTYMGFAGRIYLVVAIILGALMLFQAVRLVRGTATEAGARRVMMYSLIYLPAALLVMVLDKV